MSDWWLNFNLENKDSFDLKAYQALLPQLKAEYQPLLEKAAEEEVFWAPDPLPPADNIYARFTYKCDCDPTSRRPDHPVWHLFWDPTIISKEQSMSNIDGDCGPCFGVSSQLQEKLANAFPPHFNYDNDYVFEARFQEQEYRNMLEHDEEYKDYDYMQAYQDEYEQSLL